MCRLCRVSAVCRSSRAGSRCGYSCGHRSETHITRCPDRLSQHFTLLMFDLSWIMHAESILHTLVSLCTLYNRWNGFTSRNFHPPFHRSLVTPLHAFIATERANTDSEPISMQAEVSEVVKEDIRARAMVSIATAANLRRVLPNSTPFMRIPFSMQQIRFRFSDACRSASGEICRLCRSTVDISVLGIAWPDRWSATAWTKRSAIFFHEISKFFCRLNQ